MQDLRQTAEITIGVVGLGLMGSSIVASLLISGHKVVALAPLAIDKEGAFDKINGQLRQGEEAGILDKSMAQYLVNLSISEDYSDLKQCLIVMECVIEDIKIKEEVFKKITENVSATTIIGTNTSAIPISELQQLVVHPERFIGIHWSEPAFLTRFLEITCGNQTSQDNADKVFTLAHQWGKEPTLLKKDIRGFITNRLMYAVYREIFQILDTQQASKEDLDKAFRYDAGSWMTLMGIFRRMDYEGLADYATICTALFPKLSNSEEVPAEMQAMVNNIAKGIHNEIGLYSYSHQEAQHWERAFASFNKEILLLASEFSAENVEKQIT